MVRTGIAQGVRTGVVESIAKEWSDGAHGHRVGVRTGVVVNREGMVRWCARASRTGVTHGHCVPLTRRRGGAEAAKERLGSLALVSRTPGSRPRSLSSNQNQIGRDLDPGVRDEHERI
jgi:hypothetical protein